jgi:hypothetical protein
MLTPVRIDTEYAMVHRSLSFASFACCALITISFGLFALSELSGASHEQVSQLVAGTPPSSQTAVPSPAPGVHRTAQPRRFIDDVAHALISPFAAVVPSDSAWVNHGIPSVVGLLVYGLGLGYLARYSRGLS